MAFEYELQIGLGLVTENIGIYQVVFLEGYNSGTCHHNKFGFLELLQH